MKKQLLFFALISLSIMCYAQKEVSIKAGTKIVLRSSYSVIDLSVVEK